MKVAVTGAEGFLGWHTRVRAKALFPHLEVVSIGRTQWSSLPDLLADVDAVVHIAGVNRDADEVVTSGNISLAEDVAAAIDGRDVRVVFANSVSAGEQTPYGIGKQTASQVLASAAGTYVDVRLPNLFGEHARAGYNSFVATFVAAAVADEEPSSLVDRPIRLLHAQQAAQALLDGLTADAGVIEPEGHPTSVAEVWRLLADFRGRYRSGDIPDISDDFHRDLFNTYRSALVPDGYPIELSPHSDERGRLVETVRTHGPGGQSFVSTTEPGFTRGEHFHLRKVERFVVVAGRAEIAMRRMLTDEVVSYVVNGDDPVLIDMPTLWTHNLTAIDGPITTIFWTNELFDPDDPDTFYDNVRQD